MFRGWLQPVADTEFRARCRYCDVVFVSRKNKDLEDHSKAAKHKRNSVRTKGKKITKVYPNKADSHGAAVKRAEIRTALFLAEHQKLYLYAVLDTPISLASIPAGMA